MHRIDSQNAVNGRFIPGNPETLTDPTYFTAVWCNALQEELCNVIEGSGVQLSKSSNTQLREAINKIVTTALQNAGGGALPTEWDGGEL